MNKICIVGRLTQDPDLRKIPTGADVCQFTVAVTRRFKRDEADFIPVVVWREAAVNCHKYLTKGSQVGVIGSLQTRKYDDKDGNKRTAFEIQADEVEFLTPKGAGGAGGNFNERKSGGDVDVSELEVIEDGGEMPF